jgi:L-fuconolactonase
MAGDAKGDYRGLAYRDEADLAAWLAKRPTEAALEPELPIIDPHHHFWDTPQRGRYLLPELLADIGAGHNIVSTVFLECRSMYRKSGPAEMAPVGEVEFVNGIAAMSASGGYGPCRVAEGIVGHADLTLGARVREVLEAEIAAGGGRFRGIRHGVSWDEHDAIQKFATRVVPPHQLRDPQFREGFAQLAPLGLSFESWQYHPQLPDAIDLARAFPQTTIILNHVGGCSVPGPMPAVVRRSSPAGRRTSANSPNARTSTSSSAGSA